MRLIPDPEINDLLLMQRIMQTSAYVDYVWTERERVNQVIHSSNGWPFKRLESKTNVRALPKRTPRV